MIFQDQVFKLVVSECDAILIACTELSFLREQVLKSVTCLDSLDCLVESIIFEASSNDGDGVKDLK